MFPVAKRTMTKVRSGYERAPLGGTRYVFSNSIMATTDSASRRFTQRDLHTLLRADGPVRGLGFSKAATVLSSIVIAVLMLTFALLILG